MAVEADGKPRIRLRSTRYLTSMGFALLLLLMVALLATGISRMQVIDAKLDSIVGDHNIKMAQVWEMRTAARERARLLYHLVHVKDPFERDELVQRFNAQARRFIEARDRLVAVGLNQEEQAYLSSSLELAKRGEATQNEVIASLESGLTEANEESIIRKVIPIQDEVLKQLMRLHEYELKAALAAERDASEAFQSGLQIMLGIGGLFLLVGTAVATYVIRGTTSIESRLHREKELAQVTLYSIGEAVITTDAEGRITSLNPIAEALTGWRHGEAVGRPLNSILQLVREADGAPLLAGFAPQQIAARATAWRETALLQSRDGSPHTTEVTANPISDPGGNTIGAALVLRDVTQARELTRQLSWAACHDALTGLINRTEFERQLEMLLEDAQTSGRQHALLYLDLDQFKVVNDTCGHMAGDELLRQLAVMLEAKIRSSDTLARLGGDEFGLLLEGCPPDKAMAMAESLRDTVSEFRFMWQDRPFDVGVSIGLVPITTQSEDRNELLSAVDAACYVAKDLGRNRVHVFEPNDQETARRTGEMHWAQQVSQALKEDRMQLYVQRIQPIADDPEAMPHLELLIRMLDKDGQIVPPMSFIPAAERYGLMPTLDRWVIRTVFQRLAMRKDIQNDTICAINLSGQSFNDKNLLAFILEQFRETGIPPRHICFEITETAAVSNLRAATQFIQALRELGCRFALDDFGSGMSSFGYLRQLKVDYLKIDGTFVKDMLHDPTDRAMVEAIHHIGHVMGLKTIAEFVESDATLELLRQIGVDYAQGFGIHRPEPIGQVVQHAETVI